MNEKIVPWICKSVSALYKVADAPFHIKCYELRESSV